MGRERDGRAGIAATLLDRPVAGLVYSAVAPPDLAEGRLVCQDRRRGAGVIEDAAQVHPLNVLLDLIGAHAREANEGAVPAQVQKGSPHSFLLDHISPTLPVP